MKKTILAMTLSSALPAAAGLTITGSAAQLGSGTKNNTSSIITDACGGDSSTHSLSSTVVNATTGGEDIWQGAISTPGANDGLRFRFNEKATVADSGLPPNTVFGADPTDAANFIGNVSATMVVNFPLSLVGTGINGIVFDHSQAPTSTSDNVIWSIAWTYAAGGATGGTTASVSNPVPATANGSQLYDFGTDTLLGASYVSGDEFYLDFDGMHNTNNQVRKGDWTVSLPDNVATLTVTARALDGAYVDNIGNEEIYATFNNAGFNTVGECIDGAAVPEPSSSFLSLFGSLFLFGRRQR